MNSTLKTVFGSLLCLFGLVAFDAKAQEVDLDALSRNRAEWPKEVTLKEPLVFPITVNGKKAGEAELDAGEKIKLVEVLGAQVVVEHGGTAKTINIRATDLVELVQAQRRSQQEAVDRARQRAEAIQKAFDQDSQQKVLLDGKLVDRSGLKIEKLKGVIEGKTSDGTVIRVQPQGGQGQRGARRQQPQQQGQQPRPMMLGGRRVTLTGYSTPLDVGKEIEVEAVLKESNANAQGVLEFRVVTAPTFEQWKLVRTRQ